ncbi:hypothetical protein [Streptomyces sp. NPDC048111]|uniref:hypothetical protein n=1 Tax=Streptomyces sp. NPDC048111 TaxID=3365500 RepID=UPI0037150006
MPWEFQFTLPTRPAPPATFAAVGANMSRHHILGRKYIQLLLALGQEVPVSDGTLKRFAGWPVSTGSTAPVNAQLNGMFFWSPFNLFVGPAGTRRVFDPSSGVEQQRPNSFPEDRWNHLKRIPGYLEGIGVKLSELASLEDTGTKTWNITTSAEKIKDELTALIKDITATVTSDKVPVHKLDEDDWAIVTYLNVKNYKFRSAEDVQSLYGTFESVLEKDVTFQEALPNDAYRFLLKPPGA